MLLHRQGWWRFPPFFPCRDFCMPAGPFVNYVPLEVRRRRRSDEDRLRRRQWNALQVIAMAVVIGTLRGRRFRGQSRRCRSHSQLPLLPPRKHRGYLGVVLMRPRSALLRQGKLSVRFWSSPNFVTAPSCYPSPAHSNPTSSRRNQARHRGHQRR